MAKAPVVTELALQNVRFLFGTMVDLRMLPQVLEQTGKAEVGEFKLVAHFPADEKAANNEAICGSVFGKITIQLTKNYMLEEVALS